MPEPDVSVDELMTKAEELLDQELITLTPVHGGRNNRVYRIQTATGPLALKYYPAQNDSPRIRQSREFSALQFMTGQGISCVPTTIAREPEFGIAVYQWIEGQMPKKPSESDIDAMLDFTRDLVSLRGLPEARELASASAHCFSADAVARQLTERLERLKSVSEAAKELIEYLTFEFEPLLHVLIKRAEYLHGVSAEPLSFDYLTLSPSDFGIHNAILGNDGKLVFIDFEYFGWDDPVKMISDVMWHPGSCLTASLSQRYFEGARAIFLALEGKSFDDRFTALHPLFGMIWCLIKLNEFLPQRWQQRVVAGQSLNRAEVQSAQLESARRTLKQISDLTNEKVYGRYSGTTTA